MTPDFKPETSALLLIDYQVGTLQLCRTTPADVAVRSACALAMMALAFKMPVVLTTSVESEIQGPMNMSLQHLLPEAYEKRIQRTGIVNAWTDPAYKAAVVATGRKQLIMGAITTDICLVFPAISAAKEGYDVQAVLDASGSPFEMSEYTARRKMEANGVVLTSTNTMIAEIVQDWSRPEAPELIKLMNARAPMQPTF